MIENKTLLTEFVKKYIAIEAEMKLLAADKKDLVSEYKDQLDVKAVQAALRIVKMKTRLDVSDAELENIITSLEKMSGV